MSLRVVEHHEVGRRRFLEGLGGPSDEHDVHRAWMARAGKKHSGLSAEQWIERSGLFEPREIGVLRPVKFRGMETPARLMMSEGASRGILVTTSHFNKASYRFVRNKPLTLITGKELVDLLGKHGLSCCIDPAIKKSRHAVYRSARAF